MTEVIADELVRPWFEAALASMPGLEPFDIHTHIGEDDPDGLRCSPRELLADLERAGSRAAVFPMHEPGGYPPANDRVLAAAAGSGGRLVAFCRLDPRADAPAEAARCIAAGARGIKLHPRAEGFTLDDPGLDGAFALADEHRLPVLVHAGRGIPALGRHAVERATRHPGARIVLAHAGISDLSWLWREARAHPNLFFDTSWWTAPDLLAVLALVPPGQVLYGSDIPYGPPLTSVVNAARCAQEVGLDGDQLASVLGGQAARLVGGEEPIDLGPAVGEPVRGPGLLLERVHAFLVTAATRMLGGDPGVESLQLARLACDVPADAPEAAACASIVELLDRHERDGVRSAGRAAFAPGIELVMTAAIIARTPHAPLPESR